MFRMVAAKPSHGCYTCSWRCADRNTGHCKKCGCRKQGCELLFPFSFHDFLLLSAQWANETKINFYKITISPFPAFVILYFLNFHRFWLACALFKCPHGLMALTSRACQFSLPGLSFHPLPDHPSTQSKYGSPNFSLPASDADGRSPF